MNSFIVKLAQMYLNHGSESDIFVLVQSNTLTSEQATLLAISHAGGHSEHLSWSRIEPEAKNEELSYQIRLKEIKEISESEFSTMSQYIPVAKCNMEIMCKSAGFINAFKRDVIEWKPMKMNHVLKSWASSFQEDGFIDNTSYGEYLVSLGGADKNKIKAINSMAHAMNCAVSNTLISCQKALISKGVCDDSLDLTEIFCEYYGVTK